jgi:predicted metal-binding membrane protein
VTARRIGVGASLLGVAALGWAYVAREGGGMMMAGVAPYLAVWVAMTVAMMLPSAAPTLLLVDRLSPAATPLFGLGYLVVWAAVGLAAYAVSMRVSWHATALLLVAAGVYQVLPLKRACLRRCRSPLAFLRRHASEPPFLVGARHGVLCVGCCAGLMTVLLALGMSSLVWMTVVGVAILCEKTLPHGERLAAATAVALVGAGLVVAVAS